MWHRGRSAGASSVDLQQLADLLVTNIYMPVMPERRPVVVLGAGCVGLTTAVRLLEAGHAVVVLASHLPSDPLDAKYASSAAGAHHLSFADNGDWRQRFLDQRTFDVFWQESESAETADSRGILRLTQTEYYHCEEKHIRFLEQLPDFRILSATERPAFADHACSFTSFTIEPARYLAYLVQRITDLGGIIKKTRPLAALSEILHYVRQPLAVVNCTGLGARSLSDVNDKTVVPVRGQVVCLQAPWVRTGWTRQIGSLSGGEGGERTYVIPRASGEVIIGGTREVNDWTAAPRDATSIDIMKRALEICPQLARPEADKTLDVSSVVKSVVVGFRPTRQDGIRLEVDNARLLGSVPIIHNYGHGGYGWQCSWGCAEEVQRIVGEESRSAVNVMLARL